MIGLNVGSRAEATIPKTRTQAAAWLLAKLSNGPHESLSLRAKATKAGISRTLLYQVRLDVDAVVDGGLKTPFMWRLRRSRRDAVDAILKLRRNRETENAAAQNTNA